MTPNTKQDRNLNHICMFTDPLHLKLRLSLGFFKILSFWFYFFSNVLLVSIWQVYFIVALQWRLHQYGPIVYFNMLQIFNMPLVASVLMNNIKHRCNSAKIDIIEFPAVAAAPTTAGKQRKRKRSRSRDPASRLLGGGVDPHLWRETDKFQHVVCCRNPAADQVKLFHFCCTFIFIKTKCLV